MWDPVLPLLAPQRDVIAVDMPGFGASPGVPEPTASALAGAVVSFIDELGLERPHVAGCSLGGWVALEVAVRGAARSVAGLCTAGLWAEPLEPRRESARRSARLALPLLPLIAHTRRGRRLALNNAVAHPERVPARDVGRLVRSYATAPAFLEASRLMRAGRFGHLAEIDVPVTLAWGEHDTRVSKPRALPPNVRSVDLPDCGHVPMWDDPELVARVLLEASGADAAEA